MKKTVSTTVRAWLDGSAQDAAATTFRAAATPVSLPYSLVVRLRGRLYEAGLLRSFKAPRPTISVGNLTLGGVGKTPFVAWLAEYFLQTARTPGLISRGYQAERQRKLFARLDAESNSAPSSPFVAFPDSVDSSRFAQFLQFNDEARELALRLPSTPHFLGSNRVDVASALVEARPDVDVLLLDDAFQHRRIQRDLNVVLLDALNPFGGGRVFPAGFLREPLSGLARADAVLLNRADLVSPERRQAIQERVRRLAPSALFAEIAQIPRFIYSRVSPSNSATLKNVKIDKHNASGNRENAVGSLVREDFADWAASRRGGRFVAFCGLGAPSGFRKTLERDALTPRSFVAFPDHRAYSASDFSTLEAEAERVDADAFLTTTKDFVKWNAPTFAGRPVFALGIGVEFLSGETAFRALLAERFPNGQLRN
ncbi:MAG: tetraacyldisaccharide 4'-kinase [Thermoguttaceae bacterium]|nr:tetraacyldisaccharide 4'-kinase [Thermoguttaceae bacterium]